MPAARPVIIGASFRTAPSGLRDSLYLDQASRLAFLTDLKARDINQALILSTCDRVEIILCSPAGEKDCQQVQQMLAAHAGIAPGKLSGQTYRLYDDEAVSHFFTVTCALDSHMIGEAQIFGQVKEAVQESTDAGMVGAELNDLIQGSVNIAKRVRNLTKIGEGAISVASAAVRLARDLHGDLSRCRGLLIGLGETGMLLKEQMQLSGLDNWMMTGTSRRVERVAARHNAHFIPKDNWAQAFEQADVIVTCAGTGRYLMDDVSAEKMISARRFKPVLLLDCGIPADVDPGVDDISDLFRYALSDIEQLAERGQSDREEAATEARAMVHEAVGDYRRTLAEKDGIPMLVALRRHFEIIRDQVLKDHPNASAEEATRLLANRLLHSPSEALREHAGQGEAADLRDTITINRVLEQLFDLSADQEDSAESTSAAEKR